MHGLCYTCLSQDRDVKFLENLKIKSILREWFKASGAGNFKVNLDEFKLCWECIAWLIKIYNFKHQVFTAQDIRLKLAHKKSAPLRNLSHLSICTKNTYDNTFEHVEGTNGLNLQNKSKSKPDDNLSKVGRILKKKRKPENGKQKLSITLRKNKVKVTKKHSKDSDYDSYEIKENTIEDDDDETDRNDNKINTQNKECEKLDSISTWNVKDISKDYKLRSQAVVLLEREKHKKNSNNFKHKNRKRKPENIFDEVKKEKSKKRKKADATDDGTIVANDGINATKVGPKSTKIPNDTIVRPNVIKVGPKAAKVVPNGTNVVPQATKVIKVDPNATKPGLKSSKVGVNGTKPGPKSSKVGPIGTNADPNATVIRPNVIKAGPKASKVFPNATIVDSKPTNNGPNATKVGPKTTNNGPNVTNDGTNATNDGPNAAKVGPKTIKVGQNAVANEDAAQDFRTSTSDLPEVKFTIVHLTEDQMLGTREIDKNDRVYGNSAFKCQTCIVGFLESTQFEKHNNEKHNVLNGTLVCRICDTRFKKQWFLELHQKSHYRSYRCRLCPFEHHRRFVIETHVVKEHGLKPSPVCPDCDIEFDTQQLLETHFETAHKEKLKCNICGKNFDTYARVRKHAETHKGKTEDLEVIPEIFDCAPCNYIFEGRAIYRAHMQYAHMYLAQNAYCADCDVQFSSTHKYKCHLEDSQKHTMLGDKKFDCAHCLSKFLTKEALLAHIVRAHRLLSHTCVLCNKGFSDQARLKNHIQAKHIEIIPDNLVKDKICQICGKRFFARSALLDHMRSHTAEKPYQCKTCQKRFAVEPLLKKHIQRMHQEDDN